MKKSQGPSGSIDSFSAFLRTVKTSGSQFRITEEATEHAAVGDRGNGRPWERMVTVLADRGVVPVPDLLKATGLGISEFSTALASARTHDMINVYPSNGTEVAELTPFGRKLATLE